MALFTGALLPSWVYGKLKAAIEHPQAQTFIQEMVNKHHFDEKALTALLSKAQIQPKILKAISRPYEALDWYRYKALFVTPRHIKDGVEYWQKHQPILKTVSEQYGVPIEIIVAILGVETRYGKHLGKYRVIDALATLAFEYPPRSQFFRSELEQFLLLTQEEKLPALSLKGSYAGAMGTPQFISSSYRHYAVDFNQNGQRDLIHSPQDAIASVANYFKQHGWKKDEPVGFPIQLDTKQAAQFKFNPKNPKPKYTLSALSAQGLTLPLNKDLQLAPEQKFAFLQFKEKSGYQYWLGLNNFYVITRYNHSHHYAMAVYELAQALKAQMHADPHLS